MIVKAVEKLNQNIKSEAGEKNSVYRVFEVGDRMSDKMFLLFTYHLGYLCT